MSPRLNRRGLTNLQPATIQKRFGRVIAAALQRDVVHLQSAVEVVEGGRHQFNFAPKVFVLLLQSGL